MAKKRAENLAKIKKAIITPVKLKSIKIKTPAKKTESKSSNINKALIENFVSLQKAMTNLAIKFDNLSDQISKLLQVFEISAKSFAEKQGVSGPKDLEKDKEFLDKLNVLLDQNKTIARGLTIMEEKIRERVYGYPPPQPPFKRPMPQMPSLNIPLDQRKFKPRPLPKT